jgi:uridylate kinase
MCRENDIPIEVFDMTDPKNLNRLLSGENVGTVVSNR